MIWVYCQLYSHLHVNVHVLSIWFHKLVHSVKTMLVNKALVLSVRRHHARVTHQIMLFVLSSAGAQGAKGSNEFVIFCAL